MAGARKHSQVLSDIHASIRALNTAATAADTVLTGLIDALTVAVGNRLTTGNNLSDVNDTSLGRFNLGFDLAAPSSIGKFIVVAADVSAIQVMLGLEIGTNIYNIPNVDALLATKVTSPVEAGSIADGAVTLAKMADLAQDQFIGRTTASTGVPQTTTITVAARTVLDDITVEAMVDTLGGASAVGTGGLARATSPTFANSIALTGSVIYTVKTSGGDFTTVGAAVTAARKLITSPSVGVTISIDDGTWDVAGYLGGGNDQGFLIQGVNTYAKTLSSVQSSSGSAGARSYILNLNTVTNIAVNDYVVIKDTSGGTNPTYLAGVFKVTNVDTGNVRITISSTHHAAAAASGSVIGTVTVMKTILNFTGGAAGIRLWDKSYLVLQNVIVVGDGTNNGISVQDLSRFYGLGTLGIVNWAIGLLLTECGEAVVETLAIGNCTTAGMYLDKHSTSTVFTMVINGCGTDGLYLLNNAFVELLGNSVVTGTTNRGITLFVGSVVRVISATSVTSSGNNYGVSISQAGTVFGTLIYSNNAVNTLYGDYLFGGNVGINAAVPVSLLQVGGSVDIVWGAGPFSSGIATLGTGGSLGSLWINAPTGNSAFNGGLGINSTYNAGGLLQVAVRIGAYGVKASGSYGSTLILSTTNGTTIFDGLQIDKTGLVTRPFTDKFAVVASTLTTTSSTYANVTAMSFAIAASTTWTAEFTLYCTGSLGGIKFQITGPASPTSVAIDTEGNTTANTVNSHDLVTAFSTPSGAYVVNVVPFTGLIKIRVTVVNGVNAGTIQLQYASATNTESNSTLLNSYMAARRVT